MNKIKRTVVVGLVALAIVGCATLNKGADPFVVRVEQTQTVANATFDFVLHVDQADRGFFRTNAPGFHAFCEWLRTPMTYAGTVTSTVPRCVDMQLNVSDLKLAYKQSRTGGNSNALYSVWVVLNSAIGQASSWSNIVATTTHPQ